LLKVRSGICQSGSHIVDIGLHSTNVATEPPLLTSE
jgi:hypothetical protein